MRSARRYITSGTAIERVAAGLMVLTLLVGCDNPTPPAPTPINQAPGITPTGTVSSTLPNSSPTPKPPAPTATSVAAWAPTINWRGSNWYLLGVNYPYYHYGNDFGGNVWGSYGVHDPSTYKEVNADFAKMSSLGVRTVRWFVFADGRAGITFDAEGLPTGIDEFVFQDFDAALEIAERHNIALNFVLLDFRFLWDAGLENGAQLGGHASVLATPEGQQALVRNVFEPIFRRYAHHPSILSWEVMNEPEWAILDAGHVDRQAISQPLTLATFRAFAKLTVDAIHTVAGTYATLGCADVKWARNWVGLGLDYYQIHYYDWMKPYSTDNLFAMRAESLRLDRPVVVGEFPAGLSSVANLRDYLDTWYANGYAGAWPWSFRGDATVGSPDATVFGAWADVHQPVVDIPPAPTATVDALTYKVLGGDSLSEIAERFDTTAEAIMEANSLSSTVIRPGQVLIIPVGSGSNIEETPQRVPSRTPTAP